MPASRGMSGGSGMGRLDGEGVPASCGMSGIYTPNNSIVH